MNMEGGSTGSGGVIRKKSSSGCLIIRKKVENRKPEGFQRSSFVKENHQSYNRLMASDDEDDDDDESSESDGDDHPQFLRKKSNEGMLNRRSGIEHDGRYGNVGLNGERKRNRFGAMCFDEYGGVRNQSREEVFNQVGVGSSMNSKFDYRKEGFYRGRNEAPVFRNRQFGMEEEEEGNMPVEKIIRVQGKNGVLKIMVNKRRRTGSYPSLKFNYAEDRGIAGSRSEDFRDGVPFYPASLLPAKQSFPEANDDRFEKKKAMKAGKSKNVLGKKVMSKESMIHGTDTISKAVFPEMDGTDKALKPGVPELQALRTKKRVKNEEEETPALENAQPQKTKEDSKLKRGGSTEKQILREKIRGMLIEAGWKIDYRPRRNRDYLDAVYINRNGTAYWSIIKAYEALKKQLEDDKAEIKPEVGFSPLSEDLINKLTRQTKKKMEEEMKRKLKQDPSGNRNALGEDGESSESDHKEEKIAPSKKSSSKSGKGKMKATDLDHNGNSSKTKNKKSMKVVKVEKPSVSKAIGRCTLHVRGSEKGRNSDLEEYLTYTAKRTILAWLIDSGTVQLRERVKYMNRKRSCVMLEGWITRDGVHCGCCSKILTLSKFELHAGGKLRQPFQNIFLESGVSLLDCLVDAWNKQGESVVSGFHNICLDGNYMKDDICSICWEDGSLICCSNCPSTFHPGCLEFKISPPRDDWKCASCMCKFCGDGSRNVDEYADSELIRCGFCFEKYHKSCCRAYDIPMSSNWALFCGLKCQEMYDQLQSILGTKHELDTGFSWSLLRRADVSDASHRAFPQLVECNSKLAVALSVMDECFLPTVDRTSGINIIHNAVYSISSMFNRLNYQGFVTAILERGEEVVSAACIRIHGSRLAEMPLIATREAYRNQGMCRRLLNAVETALVRLKVENLIIPVLPEQTGMWTGAFGLHQLEDELKKDTKSMLVFPETEILQKDLLKKQQVSEGEDTGTKGVEPTNNQALSQIAFEKTPNSSCSPAVMLTDYSTATDSASELESDSGDVRYETNGASSMKDNTDSTAATENSCAESEDADA